MNNNVNDFIKYFEVKTILYIAYQHLFYFSFLMLMVCFILSLVPQYFFKEPRKKQPTNPPRKILIFATTVFCTSLFFTIIGTILVGYQLGYKNQVSFAATLVYAGIFFNLWVFPSGIRYFYKRLKFTRKIMSIFRIKRGNKRWEI